MVNFPSVSCCCASFLDCLVCPCIASTEVHVCIHANKRLHVVSPLCNHLHDGLIGLAAKGPKGSAA